MKKPIIVAFIALSIPLIASSQTPHIDSDSTIIQSLVKEVKNKGKVIIHQDDRIAALIDKQKPSTGNNQNFTVGKGYRIQIYSGNDQNRSKKEAFDRDAIFKRDFPELETFITFKSPFWRMRVGNFSSYEEAFKELRRIKEAYPQYGKETYIVKDDIKIYIK